MKTVIFLNDGYLGDITEQSKLQAIIFNLNNGKVSGIENEVLFNKNINYLTLWCLSKGVKEIYTQKISLNDKRIFQKLDINVKTPTELSNDPLFATFVFRK